MTKVVLNSALSTYDVGIINANFAKIQTELQDKVLYRNNPVGEPNTLETDVNANDKRIYNLPEPTTSGEPLRLEDLENVAGNLQDSLDAATEAAASAAAASVSAASASSSASNAASSATSADASELAAANSAASAAGSADTATQQAILSTAYSNVAGGYAGAASASAFDADASANGANASAIAAGNSATAAAASAVSAAASAASAAGAVSGHISDPTDAHAATAITNTPAGGVAATTVQAAINELDTEKLSTSATTLPATFTASSLTSVGTLTALTVSGQASFAAGSAAAPSVKVGAGQDGLFSLGSTAPAMAANGLISTRFGSSGTAANYPYIYSVGAGAAPVFTVLGSDTDISAIFGSKGAGSLEFFTNGPTVRQFRITHTASAVDYLTVTGSSAGFPVLSAAGASANVAVVYATKGTAQHLFSTNGTAEVQLSISHTASAVNYWNLSGSATGGIVTLTTQGSDTNVGGYLATKGTGAWRFATGGGDQFRVQHVASAVNFWSAYGGPTSFGPVLYADGTDVSLNANYSLKGSGSHVFYTGNTSAVQLVIAHIASSVNWPVISGSATGNAVVISTNGTDTNRSLSLTAAGTGLVQITNDSLRIVTSKTPASASATGTQGQIAWDASYIYVCTATDTWKRAALTTW